MSKLRAVKPKTAEPNKSKVLVFGKPGVGKTWMALDFPKVYYIDTEGGANLDHYTDKLEKGGGVYLGPEQGGLSFDTIIEQVKALATEKHEFRTLVIDSITKLFNVAIADEADRIEAVGKKNEFGADKKPAVGNMRRLVAWLTRLDMNVILIAHSKPEWTLVNGAREQTGETFDCWDKLEYELDLCIQVEKRGPRRVGKVRKSRLVGFPDAEVFDWDYNTFADRYGRAVIEGEVRQIVLASAEQVAEIERLAGVVKLPDGQIEKWFTASGVQCWAEMDAERVAKAINHLKGLI